MMTRACINLFERRGLPPRSIVATPKPRTTRDSGQGDQQQNHDEAGHSNEYGAAFSPEPAIIPGVLANRLFSATAAGRSRQNV